MRALLRSLIAASIAVVVTAAPVQVASAEKDPPEPLRKHAAEAVGEGNAARWLDYYRRERGENWSQPTTEGAQKPTPPEGEPTAQRPAPPSRDQ